MFSIKLLQVLLNNFKSNQTKIFSLCKVIIIKKTNEFYSLIDNIFHTFGSETEVFLCGSGHIFATVSVRGTYSSGYSGPNQIVNNTSRW